MLYAISRLSQLRNFDNTNPNVLNILWIYEDEDEAVINDIK